MKFKALITALTLSLVMSCMAVPAFAAEDNDEALDKTGAAQEQVAEEQDNDSEKAKEEEAVELDKPELKTVMQSTKRVKIKWSKVDDAKVYVTVKDIVPCLEYTLKSASTTQNFVIPDGVEKDKESSTVKEITLVVPKTEGAQFFKVTTK